MPAFKELPDSINGFKIIKDLGFVKSETAIHPYRLCIAECKKCLKYFNARPTDLRKISSCLCKRLPIVMMDNHRLKNISKDMYKRCYNPKSVRYSRYGGRGITICDEWFNSRITFFEWALNNGYDNSLTIDRIDNDKGYSPENCRWVSYETQNQNSTACKLNPEIVIKIRERWPDSSYTILAKEFNVSKSTISRIVNFKIWKNL